MMRAELKWIPVLDKLFPVDHATIANRVFAYLDHALRKLLERFNKQRI